MQLLRQFGCRSSDSALGFGAAPINSSKSLERTGKVPAVAGDENWIDLLFRDSANEEQDTSFKEISRRYGNRCLRRVSDSAVFVDESLSDGKNSMGGMIGHGSRSDFTEEFVLCKRCHGQVRCHRFFVFLSLGGWFCFSHCSEFRVFARSAKRSVPPFAGRVFRTFRMVDVLGRFELPISLPDGAGD